MQLLPITEIVVEVASFDIQKIKNPDIEGTGYQQGEQFGFWNVREYVLHRDNHRCQHPNCKHKKMMFWLCIISMDEQRVLQTAQRN